MIDEWPRDLVDLLINPKPSEPVAIWIGAGLGAELGYPLTTPLVERLLNECHQAGCAPADIQIARELLNTKRDYRLAAEQCWQILNDPARFRQVLVDALSLREENETGLQACENMLRTPFDTYITTNYNISLSKVARDLAERNRVYDLAPDVVYPYVDPSKLRERCIHYIHSNVTQAGDMVLRESTFLDAYAPNAPLPEFLAHLFTTHNLVFFGTDARDEDIMWILHRMQRVFAGSSPPVPPKRRYILLPTTEHGAGTVHPLEGTYAIQPVWFTVTRRKVQTEQATITRIEDRGSLYKLLANLQEQTEIRWRRERVS